jgi:iron(III) transport system ATP-binding protein
MELLSVSGIRVEEAGHPVLKGISFKQQESQKIAIAGETGSGKSTLLQTIAGFVQPTAGEVFFEEERVLGPQEKLVPGHLGIAYLSQHFELPKSLRVEQVLRYANTLSGEEAGTLYEVCRISHLLQRRTNQLSGGEKQRIAMARLLIAAPKLLLLDEPYSNLDTAHKNILKAVVRDIGERLDITCILISHDPQDTLSWADEILVMKDGLVLQEGTPEQVYRQPLNEYTAALFGNYNLLSPAQAKAFAALPGIQMNGKSMLVRPENFRITAAEEGMAVKGTVQQVRFFGGHYEVEVRLPETVITLKTGIRPIAAGDAICISLTPDDVWYI